MQSAAVFGSVEPGLGLFKQALEHSSAPTTIVDATLPDLPVVYVNEAFVRATGYRRDEVIGRNCRFLHAADPDQPALNAVRRALRARQGVTVILRNFRKTGELFWNELTIIPLYAPNGSVSHFLGIQKDITRERLAREAVESSERSLREVLDCTPAGVVLADLTTRRLVFANDYFLKMLGYAWSELHGQSPAMLHPPESVEWVMARFADMAAGTINTAENIPVRRADGSVFTVSVRCNKVIFEGHTALIAVFHDTTERDLAQAAAREHLAKTEAVLEAHPDLIFTLDAAGRILSYNQTARSVRFGRTAVMVGKHLVDFLPAHAADQVMRSLLTTVHLGRNTECSYPVTRDGTTEHFETRMVPLLGDKVLALVRRITDQVAAERSLAEREREFSRLFESMAQGVVYQSRDGTITNANPAALRLLGLTRDQITGRTSMDPSWRATRADGSDFPGEEHPAMIALRTGVAVKDVVMGVYHPQRDAFVWILVSAEPLFDEGDTLPSRVFATFTDITELKQAMLDLSRSQEYVEQAGRLAKIGTWEVDLRRRVIRWSTVTRLIHEVPDAYVPTIEDAVAFYKPGPDRERIVAAVQAMQRTGDTFDLELRMITAAGSEIWVRATGRGVMQGGECVQMFGTIQDITEAKRLEEEMLARRAAEQASKAKSEFMAKISHEIRTPLNAIVGFGRLLAKDTSLDRKHLDHARTIARSGEHLLTMINDMLDYARIESGKAVLVEADFDLDRMLGDICDMFRLRADEKGLAFRCVMGGNLPCRVNADQTKLRQILVNLLGNAAKFTDTGTITLRVNALGRGNDGRTMLSFDIEDTGSGISKEDIPRLFDEFFQGERGQKVGGTGLGLPICRTLVSLLGGGDIRVASTLGMGSCFSFEIPVREVTVDPGSGAHRPFGLESQAPPEPRDRDERMSQRAALQSLPRAVRTRMRRAVSAGDSASLRELIAEAERLFPPSRPHLERLANAYDYDELQRLLGED